MAVGPCLNLPAFEYKKYEAYDRFNGNGPYGEKNQSERSDFSRDYLAI